MSENFPNSLEEILPTNNILFVGIGNALKGCYILQIQDQATQQTYHFKFIK